MLSFNTFKDYLLDYLNKYPPVAGKFILIRKQIFPHSDEIDDMRIYINQELINALTYYHYCLIEKLSTQDYLVLLDIHDGYKDNLNYVSRVVYDYDHENDKVIECEIEKILIDQEFSLTPEELEKIISEMTKCHIQ